MPELWDQPLPGLAPAPASDLAPFIGCCAKCGDTVLDAGMAVNIYPSQRGNLRLIVAEGELHAEAVPLSQQLPGDNLHLAHVVTCRPRKKKTKP